MNEELNVDYFVERILLLPPPEISRLINDSNMGMGAVLKTLDADCKPLPAGKISEKIGVSEARVTALLKKLSKKNYVEKITDDADRRITLVRLTDEGRKVADNLRENLRANVAAFAGEIGVDKLDLYLKLTEEINEAFKKLDITLPVI
ncbi:MAG: MarR family winged helix-turn-helix transcriptional regulator [Christensenellales bacterium]